MHKITTTKRGTYSIATLKLPNRKPKNDNITAITNAIDKCVFGLRAIDIAYLFRYDENEKLARRKYVKS